MLGPVEKRLISFVHYSDSNDQMLVDDSVLIRIGNLYLQYNRAKYYNIDTDMPNTVTITHAIADDDVSDRLAALSTGQTYEYRYSASILDSTANQNRFLVIRVCSAVQYNTSQMDYATVRIYFSDEDNISVLSDCTKEFIPLQRTQSSDTVRTPTISPTIVSGNSLQHNDPIVDRDDNDNNRDTNITSSSNDNNATDNDNDGRFEGIIYVIISSALGVIFFAGTGYYYVAQHIQEHQKIMALEEANGSKYPKKQTERSGTTTATVPSNINRIYRTDVEDLSVTAEEDDDDDDDDDDRKDALYVMYDSHLLEI
jgi:hypothetical protein